MKTQFWEKRKQEKEIQNNQALIVCGKKEEECHLWLAFKILVFYHTAIESQ